MPSSRSSDSVRGQGRVDLKNRKHLGAASSLPGGSEIGILIKVAMVDIWDGRDFQAVFDGLGSPITGPATEVMCRTGTRVQQA